MRPREQRTENREQNAPAGRRKSLQPSKFPSFHCASCRRKPAPNRLQSVDYRRSFERSEETSAVSYSGSLWSAARHPVSSPPRRRPGLQPPGLLQTSKHPSLQTSKRGAVAPQTKGPGNPGPWGGMEEKNPYRSPKSSSTSSAPPSVTSTSASCSMEVRAPLESGLLR